MTTVDTGFFLLLLALGFTFTFGAFKSVGNVKGKLHIIALALFVVLGAYTSEGYEVSMISEPQGNELHCNSTGDLILNVTKPETHDVFISAGENTYWISFVFMGLASLNLIVFAKDVWTAT